MRALRVATRLFGREMAVQLLYVNREDSSHDIQSVAYLEGNINLYRSTSAGAAIAFVT